MGITPPPKPREKMQVGVLAKVREDRGLAILRRGYQISKFNESIYEVKSQTNAGEKYGILNSSELGMLLCSCLDNAFRDRFDDCKHIKAMKLRECKRCGSYDTVKHGIRKTEHYDRQTLHCKHCDFWFSLKLPEESAVASQA